MSEAVLFRPSPEYAESLSALYRRRPSLDRKQLLQGVRQIVKYGLAAKDDPARRNRLWLDATRLLLDVRPDIPAPNLLDLDALNEFRKQLQNARVDDAPSELQPLTEAVFQKTFTTFEALQRAGGFEAGNDTDDWLTQFSIWFARQQPYVLQHLPDDDGLARAEIGQRIEWLVSNLPSHVQSEEGLHEVFVDRAWSYVHQHWKTAG